MTRQRKTGPKPRTRLGSGAPEADKRGPGRNIELKARCDDLARARRLTAACGAHREALLHHVDTYFEVPPGRGRLKLREIVEYRRGKATRRCELIHYHRPTATATRDSRYTLVPVPEPALLKAALSAALGVKSIVRKKRELWMFANVRIHLDRVERLGTFIEFEAVVRGNRSIAASRRRLDYLERAMEIGERQRIAGSYGEMV